MSNTQNLDPVALAIAAAEAAAAANQAASANVPAVAAAQGSTAVAVPGAVAPKLKMDDMQGGMNVDSYIKVNEDGLKIGDNPALIEKIKVVIKMTDGFGFMPMKAVKYGNPAVYLKTYDGVTCASGGSWDAALAKANSITPGAREYRSVDIPMDLIEPAMSMKGVEVAKAGTKLGHTTSTTNWGNWAAFYAEVAQEGLMGRDVEVEISSEARKNKNNNTWGVLTFNLIGEAGGE